MNFTEKLEKYLQVNDELKDLYLKQQKRIEKIKTLSTIDRDSINAYFFLKNNQYNIDSNLAKKVELFIKNLGIEDVYELQIHTEKKEKELEFYSDNYSNLRHVIYTILEERNLEYDIIEKEIDIPLGTIKKLTQEGEIYEDDYYVLCNFLNLKADLFMWKERYSILPIYKLI